MSKTRRRPVNHGKHADPAEIRRNAGAARGEAARSEAARPRRNVAPGASPAPAEEPPAEGHPPWTNAGDYLRAAAIDEAPARFGTPPAPIDDYARRVWRTAFGLAVRRRFEPGSPLAEISRSAFNAVHTHEAAALHAIDVEMLMRAELGEPVPVLEFEPDMLVAAHLLVFASLADELALGDDELDELVTQAEQLTR